MYRNFTISLTSLVSRLVDITLHIVDDMTLTRRNNTSNLSKNDSGIPQDSILGPILFSLLVV